MKLIKQHPLVSFFVLAYAITWSLQLAAIALAPGQGMSLSNETNFQYFLDLLAGRLNSGCLLYTSPSPRDRTRSRMPSSA